MSDLRAAPVRIRVDPEGPTYVEGPAEILVDGEEPILVNRFRVAICACRRSGRYPLCDGTHAVLVDGEEARPVTGRASSLPTQTPTATALVVPDVS